MTGRLSQWLRPVAAVAGVVAVAAVLVLVNGHDGSDRSLSPRIPPTCQTNQADSAGERNALASRALKRQDAALRLGSQAGYLATWDSRAQGARWHAEHIYANLRALRITELDPRYDGAGSGLSLVAQQRLGTDAWKAEVDVSYALAASDPRRAETTVSFTFVRRGEVALVVAIEPAESKRTPIWLLPRLNVARSARTLVAATTAAEARRVGRHLRQAVEDVEKVLPSWAGKLVAYVPGNSVQLEALLAASPGSYDGIAAVTTTVDGSERQDAPVVIVVNPAVLDDLGPIGSHVVVTHESTHVATNAAVVKMPLWVAEGFADYVGVGAVDVPLPVSAGTVIRDVRRQEVPTRLPSDRDFGSRANDLEAYYEQAWLANLMIAQRYGEAKLVAFYKSIVADPEDRAGAFKRLGTTEPQFTRAWRRYLRMLVT